jgi:uncharacterized peroxidase-related enzyme
VKQRFAKIILILGDKKMSKFTVHTLETAPAASRPVLEKLKEKVGIIPNLAATMSESPTLINAFVTLRGIWQESTFSPLERELIAATNAVTNKCTYCVAIHSTFALKEGLEPEALEAVRAGKSPDDPRLKALADFARKMMISRGQISEADLEQFLAAGFTKNEALEVVVGAAVSVLANFANHLTAAPLDDFFQPQVWKASA